MAKLKYNLAGLRFGKWLVLGYAGSKWNEACWHCICDCSQKRVVTSHRLRAGISKSCGCGQRGLPRPNLAREGAARWVVFHENYRKPALARGLVFELTEEEFESIATQCCFYCGIHPYRKQISKAGEIFLYNGIDRRNNAEGYTQKNSVPCCRPCNVGKNNGTEKDYIERCKRVAEIHA